MLSAFVFNDLAGHIGKNPAEYLQLSQQLNYRIAIPVALLAVFDSLFDRAFGRLAAEQGNYSLSQRRQMVL